MSVPEGYEIRVVCDMVAAHKNQRVLHVDVWRRGPSGLWHPIGRTKSGEPKTRIVALPNPVPEELSDVVRFKNANRVWAEMHCPAFRCKSRRAQGRQESFAAALEYYAELGRVEVTLGQLGDKLDRTETLTRTSAEALRTLKQDLSAD